jgi:adenine deaminase
LPFAHQKLKTFRNLLFNAGFAAAYGMGREEALKAITIVPAEIFGVSDKLGSIEVGKAANVVVSDGDPFETKTNIIHVFIDGWQIPMVSRHTQLYDEFLKREPGSEVSRINNHFLTCQPERRKLKNPDFSTE